MTSTFLVRPVRWIFESDADTFFSTFSISILILYLRYCIYCMFELYEKENQAFYKLISSLQWRHHCVHSCNATVYVLQKLVTLYKPIKQRDIAALIKPSLISFAHVFTSAHIWQHICWHTARCEMLLSRTSINSQRFLNYYFAEMLEIVCFSRHLLWLMMTYE